MNPVAGVLEVPPRKFAFFNAVGAVAWGAGVPLVGYGVGKALGEVFEEDFKKAETLSLPVTLLILIVAFGSLVAAGLPLLLALSAVMGTIGLVSLFSQVAPVDESITSVILLIGLAVGDGRRRRDGRVDHRPAGAAVQARRPRREGPGAVAAPPALARRRVARLGRDPRPRPRAPEDLGLRGDGAARRHGGPRARAEDGRPRNGLAAPRPGGDPDVRPHRGRVPRRSAARGRRDQGRRRDVAGGRRGDRQTAPRRARQRPDARADAARRQPRQAGRAPRPAARRQRLGREVRGGARHAAREAHPGDDRPHERRRGVRHGSDGAEPRLQRPHEGQRADRVRLRAGDGLRAPAGDLPLDRDPDQGDRPQPPVGGDGLRGVGADLPARPRRGLLGFQSSGAMTSWLPLFLFVILFGLSMDYHVFILSRVREAFDRGMSTEDAVSHGIRSTAGVVTSAAIVMVAVFAIFA
ncbi:MAG: MMPL family transporter, partial [Actinobacteria bacterium]|nr:MMPL family transporter [Actinomycetota bacterium]